MFAAPPRRPQDDASEDSPPARKMKDYCQVSNISCTLVGKKIVDNSDVFGALPVGTAPTTSSFST